MVKQVFSVKEYWEVIVFYDVDYSLFYLIEDELYNADITKHFLKELYYMMFYRLAKAVTFSNTKKHISVVIFNTHSDSSDYIDSIVHEAEHIKQAMLYAYNIKDAGEPPAYTIGYLVSQMYKVFRNFICDC